MAGVLFLAKTIKFRHIHPDDLSISHDSTGKYKKYDADEGAVKFQKQACLPFPHEIRDILRHRKMKSSETTRTLGFTYLFVRLLCV